MDNFSYSLFSDKNFVDCTLFQFGREQCEPAHSFGPAARNHFLFHYIMSGKGTLFSTNNRKNTIIYTLHGGQGFLISPGQTNTYIADESNPWSYAWLEFDGLKAAEFLSLSGLTLDQPIYNSSDPLMKQTMQEEMLYIVNNNGETPLNLIGHLYLFLDALMRSASTRKIAVGGKLKDFYAREAITFIEQNYQRDIRVEDIAEFCNLNRSYFSKIFKDVLSTNPQDFLIQYRMTKACEHLQTTNMSIGDISTKVGYPNQLHFSRAFKKVYGVSPREWKFSHLKR